MVNSILCILKKDLTLEKRQANTLIGMLSMAFILTILVSFGVQISLISPVDKEKLFSLLIWVIGFFSASLYIPKFFEREWEMQAIESLILSGIKIEAIYIAKFLAITIISSLNQILSSFIFCILLNISFGEWFINYLFLIPFVYLSFSLIAALFAPFSYKSKLGTPIFTLISIPPLIPLFFTALEITQEIRYDSEVVGFWIFFLLFLNILYFTLGILLTNFTYKNYS